ncbi:MAG: pitrilysin family protein [Acidobacteria bacterium]|nr:pitrilysin family protein [Acidobacteriota bacterium]
MRSAAALAVLLLSGTATAGSATPEPGVGAAQFELDNGMTFLVVERPGRPLVAAVTAVRGGSASDPAGRRGLTHLVEHLLFAGSRKIGTTDWEAESRLLSRWEDLYERSVRRGRTDRDLLRLEQRLEALQQPGEFAGVYARAGVVGVDALTHHDLTAFHALVPKEKIELWFWMESDRLHRPVFRGFRRELQVVEQERRQRIDSTPTGTWFELFDAAYWGAGHPYAHTPGGERREVERLLPSDARSHFEALYRPDRLIAVLVGDVSLPEARELGERYFGRLRASGRNSRTRELKETPDPAVGSLEGLCACRSQVEIRYPTLPFAADGDTVVLDFLAGLLNSRSGRLYRGLVAGEDRVAYAASAEHVSRKLGGYFAVRIEAGEGARPKDLTAAWDALLDGVGSGGVDDAELSRVRRQLTTDSWRQLEQDTGLAGRLAAAEALGGWRQLTAWLDAAVAVDGDDLQRVVDRYLLARERAVLSLARTGG